MYQLQIYLYRRSICLFGTRSHVHFLTVFFEYLGTGTGGHQRDGGGLPCCCKTQSRKRWLSKAPVDFMFLRAPIQVQFFLNFVQFLGKNWLKQVSADLFVLVPLLGLGNPESATEYEDFSTIDIFWYCSGARMRNIRNNSSRVFMQIFPRQSKLFRMLLIDLFLICRL